MNKLTNYDPKPVERSLKRKKTIGACLLKNTDIPSPSKIKREDLTPIIDRFVMSKRGQSDNKLYQFMTRTKNKHTSLIQTFFTDNCDTHKQVLLTSIKRKDYELEAQEEYTLNKRMHNIEYNKELRKVLLKNYKRFQFPKVLTKSDKYLIRFESYSVINQRDVNLGLILDNMKKNYIMNNKNKPKHLLNISKKTSQSVDYAMNKQLTIQSIFKKTSSVKPFQYLRTTDSVPK
jgi:hypothetical protein